MLFDAQNRIEKIMKVQEEEDKENEATDNENEATDNKKEDVVDLEYTAEDVEKSGVRTMGDTQDHDKAQKILVWLANWFLPAIISQEAWKLEVLNKIHNRTSRKQFFTWVHHSDLAFLCVVYIHCYNKWKNQIAIRRNSKRKLTPDEKKTIEDAGHYGKDGVSSVEGKNKMKDINIYIVKTFKQDPDRKREFDTAFWDYFDEHIMPEEQRRSNECNKKPKDLGAAEREAARKKKEEEDNLMYYNDEFNTSPLYV